MPKLLIVDDEIDVREFAKNFFKKRRIEVWTAAGGATALEIIEKEKPDLVLLDVRMEEINGIDVLKKLKAESSKVKVIMVTGAEDEATIKEANELGAVGYIHKPLVLEELERIVLKELQTQDSRLKTQD